MEWTDEQKLVIGEAKTSKANLLINALAGAAKTTTLVALASGLPLVPTISLAFNKRIADEMAKRMPSHIASKTMNSIGHSAWSEYIGRRPSVDTGKMYGILKYAGDKLSKAEREEIIGDDFAGLLRVLRLLKSAGYIPPSSERLARGLVTWEEAEPSVLQQCDLDLSENTKRFVDSLLERSITMSYDGIIDFDDQIYMSTLFPAKYSKFPIVMIDEAQDLSPLNHATLEKLYGGRLIAVGDPNQAIYAFRGASTSSMSELKSRFNMRELTLSTSFRCPRRVVEHVNRRVPHMRAPSWAIEGTVERLEKWSSSNVPDGAAVICRNNAPLFKLGLNLLRAGRGIHFLGNDIGKGLIKVMKDLGPGDMTAEQARGSLQSWADVKRQTEPEARQSIIEEKVACIEVFLEFGKTLDMAIAYANSLFESTGPIQLMTGHKSKGGEWDIVFFLDSFLIPSKRARIEAEFGNSAPIEQELNLGYVIATRAKQNLYFVDSETFS